MNRGAAGVPGVDSDMTPTDTEAKSKNAKRREAARKKASATQDGDLAASMEDTKLSEVDKLKADWRDPSKLATKGNTIGEDDEQQKKIRNVLKKLKAVRELKEKKLAGERLSPDQLVKIGKKDELLRDLRKLGHEDIEDVESKEETIVANGKVSKTQDG